MPEMLLREAKRTAVPFSEFAKTISVVKDNKHKNLVKLSCGSGDIRAGRQRDRQTQTY